MKNKAKLLTMLTATSMMLTTAGQMNVFAKGSAVTPDELNKVPGSTNTSKRDLLEENLVKANKKVDETKKAQEEAQKKYDDYRTLTYDVLNSNKNSKWNTYDSLSIETQNAIVNALEKQIAQLEANQKELNDANETKKGLASRLDEATKALLEAQTKLKKAQSEYDALLKGSDEEALSKDVVAKKQALENAQKDFDAAKEAINSLNTQKLEAENRITAATQSVNEAKVAYENAQSVTSQAQKEVDAATSNYNEKKAIYESATDPALKAQYEADVIQAEKDLVTAQNNLKSATDDQSAKENAVNKVQTNLNQVNTNIQYLQSQIDSKQKELEDLSKNVEDAKAELNSAKQQLELARQDKDNKDTALSDAKKALETAKEEVRAQQTKVDEAQAAVTAQQKVVDQLRTDASQAQAKIAQGSKGFFEAYGYTAALKILDEQSTANGGSTNIGAANDATSLENFKRALSMVRYGNTLRTTDTNVTGLNDLKVNPTLFAISQVQINATANGNSFGHSQLYYVGENIAAASYKQDDKGLYNGWYTLEKAVYDYITAKGWTEDDLYNDANKYKEVQEALGQRLPQVGHYTNIINKDYAATGTAYIYSSTASPDGWKCNAGQVFDFLYSSFTKAEDVMTIDEFEAQFNEYYNKLMNADTLLQENQSKLENLKAELKSQKALLASKQATQSSAETNVQTATDQVISAQNAVTSAQSKVDTKLARLDQLMSDSTASSLLNEINSLKASKKNAETNDLVNAQKVLSAAQKEKMIADQNVVDKTTLINDAKSNLDLKKKVLAESNKGIELAQSNLEVAKKNLDEKTNVLTSAKSDESSKKGLYDSSKNSLNRLNVKLSELNKDLEAAKNSVTSKEESLKSAQSAYDGVVQTQNEVKDLKLVVLNTQSLIDEYKEEIQTLNDSMDDVDAQIKELTSQKVAMESRKAGIEKVKSAYDKLSANPSGAVDVLESEDEIVLGLYSRVKSMKSAYDAYVDAVNEFNNADIVNAQNKEALDVATKNYEDAKAELKKAQDELDAYLKVTGTPGWHQLDGDWYYVDENGNLVTNDWVGNYYFESDGKMATNKWIGNDYVGSDGVWVPYKWVSTNGKYWYRHPDGTYTKNDFETIVGHRYYFDANGYMVTGWQKINGQDYYFNASGVMATNTWVGDYYLDADGTMLTNSFTPDGCYVGYNGSYLRNQWFGVHDKEYYFGANGVMYKNAWSGAYYLGSDGAMLKNQFTPDGYYVGESGAYLTNQKVTVLDKDYYLNAYGTLAKNQWAGDYYVDSNNNPFKDTWAGSYYVGSDGKYVKNEFTPDGYYCGADGVYVTNRWIHVDGKDYYMNASGKMTKDAWVGNYYLGSDGAMLTNTYTPDGYYVDENGLWTPSKWVQSGGNWLFRHSDGTHTTNDFEVIGSQTYYFDSNGYMVTGWKQLGSNWYYFNGSGIMVQNNWAGNYYFDGDGKMVRDRWIGNYYVGSDGCMVTNHWIGNYYVGSNGLMVTGWQCIYGQWYYFDSNGIYQTGERYLGGEYYYFNAQGVMQTGTAADGWEYNSSGQRMVYWSRRSTNPVYHRTPDNISPKNLVRGTYSQAVAAGKTNRCKNC